MKQVSKREELERNCLFFSRTVDKIAISIRNEEKVPLDMFTIFIQFVMIKLPDPTDARYFKFHQYVYYLMKHEEYDIKLKFHENSNLF